MTSFEYRRDDLRDSHHFTEWDHYDVDPRRTYRNLKQNIEDITDSDGFKYQITEPAGATPAVDAEPVGTQNGRVTGRLVAASSWTHFTTEKRSGTNGWALLGGLLGVVGLLLFLGGLNVEGDGQAAMFGVGLVFVLLGGAIYYFSSSPSRRREYYFRKRARVLLKGEVAERVVETPEQRTPQLVASAMRVSVGEDVEVQRRESGESETIPLDALPEEHRGKLNANRTSIVDEIEAASGERADDAERAPA